MRRWIVLLLAGLMVFGLFGCGTKDGEDSATGDSAGQPEESTPTTTEADTNTDPDPSDPTDDLKQYEHTVVLNSGTEGIKILGERSLESSTQLNCDWTCSGLEFVIDCKGGNLTLRTSTTDPCYFRVWVDGEAWENTDGSLYYMINGTKNLVVPDMPVGEHTVRVLKVTGYTLARAHFYSMTFYGSLLADKAPQDNELYIEFVGDSISCGWGVIGDHAGAYTDQDGAQAYPYLVAEALEADYAVTALSGQGLLMGNPGMTKGYLYGSPLRDSETEYGFERKADIVVINIGTNDYGYREQYGIDEAAFKEAYLDFLKTVYRKNGANCKIYCLYNSMNDTFAQAILEACEEVGGEAAGVYTLELERAASGHPTLEEQNAYAWKITAYLNETKDNEITEDFGPDSGMLESEEHGTGMEVDWSDDDWIA